MTTATEVSTDQPLTVTESESRYDIHVSVKGGGPQGQADAVIIDESAGPVPP